MKYSVKIARSEDINAAFVWVSASELSERSIARIKNNTNGKSIWCEVLNIDDNFRNNYNERNTIDIPKNDKNDKYIVISEWYRDKLGVDKNKEVELTISQPWWSIIPRRFLAACHHPDNVVKLSVNIAIVSLVLGFLSIVLGGISIYLAICL